MSEFIDRADGDPGALRSETLICRSWLAFALRSFWSTMVTGLVRYGCVVAGGPHAAANGRLTVPVRQPLWWRTEARRGLRELDAYRAGAEGPRTGPGPG